MADGDRIWFYANGYFDGSSNRYLQNGFASRYYQANSSHVWETAPSGTAGNAISFTQAMTLDASGRLGIGATSMTYALQVNDTAGGNMFRFASGSTVLDYYVSGGNPSFGTASNNDLRFRTNDTTRLTIASTGAATFSSSVTAGGLIQTSGTSLNASVRITNTTSSTGVDWHLYSLNNGNFGLYNNTSGSYAYTITPTGSVGIGTTAPTTNLQVYQGATAGNNYVEGTIQVGGTSSTLGGAFSYAAQNSGYVNITNLNNGGGANARISFGFGAITSGLPANNVMTINQSGNVGIGKTNPGSKLSIVGLPTSSAGLTSGDIYVAAGVLMIV
jgi:hypothetical protein